MYFFIYYCYNHDFENLLLLQLLYAKEMQKRLHTHSVNSFEKWFVKQRNEFARKKTNLVVFLISEKQFANHYLEFNVLLNNRII